MRPAPCEQRRRRTLQHVAGFVGRIRGLRMRHSVAELSDDQYSKPTRQQYLKMSKVGENRFGGEDDERLENGEDLEIAATERQNLQSPAVSGRLGRH